MAVGPALMWSWLFEAVDLQPINTRSNCWLHRQAVLKANPGMKSSSKRPNLLMTAGIGVAERDEKKEHLYSLMGGCCYDLQLRCSLFFCVKMCRRSPVGSLERLLCHALTGAWHCTQIHTSKMTS